jgi:hypothetical protein
MDACIVVSLMAGVRPEEARAIGWEEDVDLDGNPPSVAVLRADRAGGDTKTPRSRRALKLAQLAVGALREWRITVKINRRAYYPSSAEPTCPPTPPSPGGTDASSASNSPDPQGRSTGAEIHAKLRIKVSSCMRSLAGALAFCAVRSYPASAAKHGIGMLDAPTCAASRSAWIPEKGTTTG